MPSPVADALVAASPSDTALLGRAGARARLHLPPGVAPAGVPGGGTAPADVADFAERQRQACAGFALRVLAAAAPTPDPCFLWASRWALACLMWCGFDAVDVLALVRQGHNDRRRKAEAARAPKRARRSRRQGAAGGGAGTAVTGVWVSGGEDCVCVCSWVEGGGI